MRTLKRISTVAVLSMMTAVSAQELGRAENAAITYGFKGGWVMAPPGDGWDVNRSRNPELSFVRGLSKDHSVAATVSTYFMDSTLSRETLPQFLRRYALEGQGRPLTERSFEVIPDSSIAPMAARYRYQVEDRNVPHHKGMTFILEAQGVFLVHPDAPHLLIVVEFSERAEASVARTEATVGDSYLAQLHLVRVDTAAVRRVAIGSYPDRVWLAHGSIWALSKPEVGTDLIRIDPSNLTILARVHFDGLISDLAPTPDAIWVTDRQNGVLLRLNPATGATTATVKCGGHPGHLLATSEVLWVTDRENGTIQSVDARSLKLVGKPIRELKHPDSMVDGGGVLWIVNKDQSRTVACLDPKTRELVGAAIPVGAGANSMAYGAGSLWVVCEEIDSIQRLDPVKHVVASTIPLGFQPSGMAFAGGVLWVGSWSTGRLMAVDPATNNLREKSCQAGLRISGLAGSDEGVWFADSPAGTVSLMPLP